MARTLVWLVNNYSGDWVDVPRCAPPEVLRNNEHGKLVWWGLIEGKPSDDSDRRHTGLWRPTKLGADFVYERVKVRERVILFNNQCEGFDGGEVTIRQALGSRFSYEELMRGR